MKKNRLIASLLCIILMFSCAIGAGAQVIEPENQIMPLYDYTNSHTASLSINNDVAHCSFTYSGYDHLVDSVKVSMTLQKKAFIGWSEVENWTITYYTPNVSFSRDKTVGTGTYRVKMVYTVYSGSDSEKVTGYSREVKNT